MPLFKTYSDKELIEYLASGDVSLHNKALKYLYTKNYPSVEKFIRKSNGSDMEARDIFQEAIIAFYENIREQKFKGKSTISTYLISIAKNMWYNMIKSEKSKSNILDENMLPVENYDTNDESPEEYEKKQGVVNKCFKELNDSCREILVAFYFKNLSMQVISENMGYANERVARSRKYECMEKLKKLAGQYLDQTINKL